MKFCVDLDNKSSRYFYFVLVIVVGLSCGVVVYACREYAVLMSIV